MRQKKEAVLPFEWNNDDVPKIVREHRAKYKGISRILDRNPEILDLVHEDLKQLSGGHQGGQNGRNGDFTSETILRALVVHAIGGDALRETVIRIAESDFLQDFLRTRKKAVMDYSFLDKCFKVIRPETWKRINEVLVQQAVANEAVNPSTIRTDTTAVETNIHWPTDASLLWDTYRVAARLMRDGRDAFCASCPYRFHDRKIRRLYLFITRYSNSKSKKRLRKVKQAYRTLVERVSQIVENARRFCEFSQAIANIDLQGVAAELKAFLPSMTAAVVQARRAQLNGEKVPAAERVFSIFEPHTELIKRGRRGQPVEFGHKVLLTQSREKFITDYVVLEKNCSDSKLLSVVLQRHEERYGSRPESIAADKGFCPDADTYEELEDEIEYLGVPRSTRDFGDTMMGIWQQWRAGIEGTISCLKRAFRLARCCFRGFKNFASAIGSAIFCHNLTVLAKITGD